MDVSFIREDSMRFRVYLDGKKFIIDNKLVNLWLHSSSSIEREENVYSLVVFNKGNLIYLSDKVMSLNRWKDYLKSIPERAKRGAL